MHRRKPDYFSLVALNLMAAFGGLAFARILSAALPLPLALILGFGGAFAFANWAWWDVHTYDPFGDDRHPRKREPAASAHSSVDWDMPKREPRKPDDFTLEVWP